MKEDKDDQQLVTAALKNLNGRRRDRSRAL